MLSDIAKTDVEGNPAWRRGPILCPRQFSRPDQSAPRNGFGYVYIWQPIAAMNGRFSPRWLTYLGVEEMVAMPETIIVMEVLS